MKRRRVKITGIGPVTPAGIGREAFWKGILEPVSRVQPFTRLEPKYGAFVAAFLENFDVEDFVERSPVLKGAARHSLFAVAGAALAMKDAGISVSEANDLKPVIIVGSSVMDFDGICRTVESVLAKGSRGALSRTIYTTNSACIPATAGTAIGLRAHSMTIQTSCCAGLDAIGHAARMVADGQADFAICGGTEAPLERCPLVELRAAGLTPTTKDRPNQLDRPFDLWRTTGVVSEGASLFVLEPESSPRPGYCYVSGYAFASDYGTEICSGMYDAMKLALADAGVRQGEIDVINAWGPGHREIDAAEARWLVKLFGKGLHQIPAFSVKGAVGNALGAAGAIQLAASALALPSSQLPPTVNWEFPDPSCPLNLSGKSRTVAHSTSLINAHGLSGMNASLVVRRC